MKTKVVVALMSSMITLVTLSGCGGSSNTQNKNTVLDNSKLADGQNEFGYFGKNVIFGETKIVGKWTESGGEDTWHYTFQADGKQIFNGGFFDGSILDYGVSSDGKTIKTDYFGSMNFVKKRSGDCYDIEEINSKGRIKNRTLCKYQ